MTSGKRINKFKTYDNSTALMMDDDEPEDNFHASAEQYPDEDDVVEQLAAEGDEDALLISEFESAAQEVLQDDAGLSSAFSAYTEARRKLSEKVRFHTISRFLSDRERQRKVEWKIWQGAIWKGHESRSEAATTTHSSVAV